MACTRVNPYWSISQREYHVCQNCTVGNNIEVDKKRTGYTAPAGYVLCERCQKIIAGTLPR